MAVGSMDQGVVPGLHGWKEHRSGSPVLGVQRDKKCVQVTLGIQT